MWIVGWQRHPRDRLNGCRLGRRKGHDRQLFHHSGDPVDAASQTHVLRSQITQLLQVITFVAIKLLLVRTNKSIQFADTLLERLYVCLALFSRFLGGLFVTFQSEGGRHRGGALEVVRREKIGSGFLGDSIFRLSPHGRQTHC